MCRNIRTLHNFVPPATDEEVHAAALQFVRKVSGYSKPSKANELVFDKAVEDISSITRYLTDHLETGVAPKNREQEASKAKARAMRRFG